MKTCQNTNGYYINNQKNWQILLQNVAIKLLFPTTRQQLLLGCSTEPVYRGTYRLTLLDAEVSLLLSSKSYQDRKSENNPLLQMLQYSTWKCTRKCYFL